MDGINQFLQTADYLVVLAYLLVVIGIGYWSSFVKKKKEGDNLFLAGNSLKWPSIGLTMWGTNVGPSMLVASCASGFSYGLAGANFSWYAFIFIIILAMYFAPYYKATKISTLPEFIGMRYNQRSREIFAWYSMVTILISWLGISLYAGGVLVSQVMGWPLPLSVFVLVAIAAFFTIAGGLEAIAATNTFQMTLLIIVSGILTVAGIWKVGGISEIAQLTPDHYWNLFMDNDHEAYPWLPIILGYSVMGIWFWCSDQSMVQSVLGAKNLKQGQLGTNFTGWLKIVDVPLFILPGILCYILYPNISKPEAAYATMVTSLLPVGMVGMVMAVLMAALISTIDSALNSFSTIFTLDVYVKKIKKDASSKQIVTIGRISTLGGALIGLLIAVGISKIEGTDMFMLFQSILGFLAPPISTVFLIGLVWKKATSRSANIILSFGSVLSLGVGACALLKFPGPDFWPHPLMLCFYLFVVLMVIAFIISYVDNAFRKEVEVSDLIRIGDVHREQNSLVWILWGCLSLVMFSLFIIFS